MALHVFELPEAAVRELVEELTLRRDEEGVLRTFIDPANVGDIKWEPPPVDEEMARSLPSHTGVEGAEWEKLHCKYFQKSGAVHIRHPSASPGAKTLSKAGEVKEKGDVS